MLRSPGGRGAGGVFHCMSASSGESSPNRADVLLDRSVSTVQHQVLAIPGVVFSCDHVCPRGRRHARNIRFSRFDAAPVFVCNRARHFDLNSSDTGAFRHGYPRVASQPEWVHTIRNYGSANAEIVFGDRISHAVADIVERLVPGCRAANGLFYGIDA